MEIWERIFEDTIFKRLFKGVTVNVWKVPERNVWKATYNGKTYVSESLDKLKTILIKKREVDINEIELHAPINAPKNK